MLIKRRTRNAEEDREKKLKKAREQKRKKMIRTKYGQARLRHSRQGMKSCIYLVLTLFCLVLMVAVSYAAQGKVGILMGFAGLFVLFLAYRGIWSAVNGFKERDKNYVTCKVGVVGCGLLFLSMCAIFVRGLF